MSPAAATQADDKTIVKPPEWAVYIVTAALKCASDEKLPATYTSHDEAKYTVLKSLNWFEAHDEYEWPDFTSFKYDFGQVMRLRRALIQDIFNALEKAGKMRVSQLDTPDSNVGRCRIRQEGRTTNTRKRLCKREAGTNDAVSEASESDREEAAFLLAVMTDLTNRAKVDLAGYMLDVEDNADKNAHDFANMLHDRLVNVWTELQHHGMHDDEHIQQLRQKSEVWERYNRSDPPHSSQRERSPGTLRKPVFGSAPVVTACGSTSVDAWGQTHTLD